jgi:hypothetical protein
MATLPLCMLNCTKQMRKVGIGLESRSLLTCPSGQEFSTVSKERLRGKVNLCSYELKRFVVILEELLEPLIGKRVME